MDGQIFIPSIHFSQPNGCLQYHTGIDGRFTTFNWGGTQHLRNQNYRVCIRQEEGTYLKHSFTMKKQL